MISWYVTISSRDIFQFNISHSRDSTMLTACRFAISSNWLQRDPSAARGREPRAAKWSRKAPRWGKLSNSYCLCLYNWNVWWGQFLFAFKIQGVHLVMFGWYGPSKSRTPQTIENQRRGSSSSSHQGSYRFGVWRVRVVESSSIDLQHVSHCCACASVATGWLLWQVSLGLVGLSVKLQRPTQEVRALRPPNRRTLVN